MIHIFHNWSKWGDLLPLHALASIQYRRCTMCNAIGQRKVDWNMEKNIPMNELNLSIEKIGKS